MPKYLAFRKRFCGPVAQLEERLNGIEEVVSSILIGSTNSLMPGELRISIVKTSSVDFRQIPTSVFESIGRMPRR